MSLSDVIRPTRTEPGRVDRLTEIDSGLTEDFLEIYRASFAPLETLAPARQALTDEEFRAEMTDERVVKFVARDGDGEVAALLLMATDLSVVEWISVPYFAARFPEHHARGAIFYVGALLVRPERQGGPWAKIVVDDMLRYVADHRGVMAFDCCGFNTDVVKLPETVARATHRLAYAETVQLDRQSYYAYVTEGPR